MGVISIRLYRRGGVLQTGLKPTGVWIISLGFTELSLSEQGCWHAASKLTWNRFFRFWMICVRLRVFFVLIRAVWLPRSGSILRTYFFTPQRSANPPVPAIAEFKEYLSVRKSQRLQFEKDCPALDLHLVSVSCPGGEFPPTTT